MVFKPNIYKYSIYLIFLICLHIGDNTNDGGETSYLRFQTSDFLNVKIKKML